MTPKKKPTDADKAVAAVTNAADAVKDAADISSATVASNAWKERVWTAFLLGLLAVFQVVALKWIDTRAADRTASTREEIKTVGTEVKEIHHATNSMKDALVEATEKEALARGGVEERKRADERAEVKQDKLDAKDKP